MFDKYLKNIFLKEYQLIGLTGQQIINLPEISGLVPWCEWLGENRLPFFQGVWGREW